MPPPRRTVDPADLTLGQIIGALRPAQLWTACVIVATVIGASFTLGQKVQPLFGQTSPEQKQTPPRQKWLIIHHVEGPEGMFVRVVATINGIPYAYPADVAYTQIGLSMSDQRLPLPLTTSYTVSFRAELTTSSLASRVEASSRDTPIFEANTLPTQSQSYRMSILNDQGMKLGTQFLTVTYSFE